MHRGQAKGAREESVDEAPYRDETGVGDLMFIEGRHDVKTPFYVHVDVATKLIIGYAMRDKTYGEMLRAIEYIGEQHVLMGHKLEILTFDRESSIVAAQEYIEVLGLEMLLVTLFFPVAPPAPDAPPPLGFPPPLDLTSSFESPLCFFLKNFLFCSRVKLSL